MAQAFLNGASYDPNKVNAAQIIERTISEIDIPEGVTKIGTAAFAHCTSIKKIIIPEGITHINGDAFKDCTGMAEIVFPESLVKIERQALMNCSKLKKIVLPSKVTQIPVTFASSCRQMTEFIAMGDITLVAANSLQYCGKSSFYFTHCTTVPVLANVNAFDFSLIAENAKIYVPASLYNEWISATNWSVFADYIEPELIIPKMEIPDHVSEGLDIQGSTVVGRGSCTDSIIVINEGENVEYIGRDAFWKDQDIEELYVLGSIVSIGASVCSSSSLKRLYMENVSTIWSVALHADELEYVRFSKNISYIGESSLQSKNESVIYDFSAFEGDEIPALYFHTPGDSLSSGIILVPAERCEEWKAATNWSYYADKIRPVD